MSALSNAVGLPPAVPGNGVHSLAGMSADVMTFGPFGLRVGRYYHGIGEWQVDGVHSSDPLLVVEWWPLPEIGTGTKCPDAA